jgi:hypothetical protein
MSTITEDYVSFEIAKLLKEKGFPQEYDIYRSMVYNEEDYEDEYEIQRMITITKLVKAGTLSSYPIGVPEPKCYCPTHQMAMQWLRDEHDILITVLPDKIHDTIALFWNVYIVTEKEYKWIFAGGGVNMTYEELIEEALLYALKTLIN